MSLKDEYTFHFSNFLIICLFNSSANCWFEIISHLVADSSRVVRASDNEHLAVPAEVFSSKNL